MPIFLHNNDSYFSKYQEYFEKTNYNDLKKNTKYQIRTNDSIKCCVFVRYDKELNCAMFNEKNNDELRQVFCNSMYNFYRIISIEEHDAKIKPFKIFQRTYNIIKGEKYKIIHGIEYTGLFIRKLNCIADESYSLEHMVFYDNEWFLMKYFNTSKIPIEYYRFVSEKEFCQKRRDKFNENALKTILNRLIDGFKWY
jgi:hypothetical protein